MRLLFILFLTFLSSPSFAGAMNELGYAWKYEIINTKMQACTIESDIFLCSELDQQTGKPHVYEVVCGVDKKLYSLNRVSVMDGFSEYRYTVRLEMVDEKSGKRDYFLLSKSEKQ